jgi:hypothetical protein
MPIVTDAFASVSLYWAPVARRIFSVGSADVIAHVLYARQLLESTEKWRQDATELHASAQLPGLAE